MLQTILVLIICFWLVWKHPFYQALFARRCLALLLVAAKIACGYGLYFLYNHYYSDRSTGDVNKYFDDAKAIYQQCHSNPKHFLQIVFNIGCDSPEIRTYFTSIAHWDLSANANLINDTRTIIRFNLLLLPFSQGAFMVHNIVANVVSFTGLALLYKAFCAVHTQHKLAAFLSVFCIPSVFFWSSGVLKEALLFFFLGWTIHSMVQLQVLRSKYVLYLLIGLWGLLLSKFYLALILLPAVIGYLIVLRLGWSRKRLVIGLTSISVIFAGLVSIFFQTGIQQFAEKQKQFVNVARGGYYFELENQGRLDTIYVLETESANINRVGDFFHIDKDCKATRYVNLNMADDLRFEREQTGRLLQHLTPANSYIYLPVLDNSLQSMIKVLPFACINVMCLPTMLQVKNPMYLAPACENLAFLLLLIARLWRGKGRWFTHTPFAWFSLFFIASLILVIGYTTPILGAIVRYKIPMLPFLFYLLLSNMKFEYIEQKLQNLAKG